MSEISRSEAINDIKKYKLCAETDKNNCTKIGCVVCEHNVSDEDTIISMSKAISDMEKLEKIEHILFDIGECEELADTIVEKVEKYCQPILNDCNKCMIQRIEQILRGEEE